MFLTVPQRWNRSRNSPSFASSGMLPTKTCIENQRHVCKTAAVRHGGICASRNMHRMHYFNTSHIISRHTSRRFSSHLIAALWTLSIPPFPCLFCLVLRVACR
jgi:hypothetical protein